VLCGGAGRDVLRGGGSNDRLFGGGGNDRLAGFGHRWQVEAQLAAFEHERKGAQNERHREAIAAQEAIFKAELERMDKEGDYQEPEGESPSMGTIWYVGKAGRGRIIV
jgi:Ca2+-binding RTX toxin-like protein